VEVFLLPATVFKFLFSAMVWILLATIIMQNDRYYDTRDWCLEKYDKFKEKKDARAKKRRKL